MYVNSRKLPKIPDEISASSSGTLAEKYIQTLRLSDVWHFRRPYVAALKGLGEEAVDPLINLLDDPDPFFRQIAASSLGEIGSSRAADALIERLSDENSNVRGEAAGALGKMKVEKAVARLTAMLEEESGHVFYGAAEALGRIGSLKALDPLIAALNVSNQWNRRMVVAALGDLGSDKAVDPLLEVLKENDLDVEVRREMMVTFLKIRSAGTTEALTNALKDEDREVRIYAREALKKLKKRRK